MAAKAGFKDLLLKKGEKIALAACAAAFAVLVFMGLASGGPEKSTAQMIKDLESATSSVKTQIGSETVVGGKTLPPWVAQTGGLRAVPSEQFLVSASAFEPISWPSLRKENPKIFKPVEGQVDVFQLALGAKDRQFELDKDGVERLKLMGVFKTVPLKLDDAKTIKENYDKSTRSDKKGGKKGGNPPPPPFPGGGRPGGTGGPGMPGGMPGMGGPGGMPGMGGGAGIRTTETIIDYVTPKEWEVGKWKEAETVHPTRLAVVQMAFPLKAQLQEVQRALRLPTLADAIRACAPVAGGSTGPGGPGLPGSGMPGPGSPDGEGPGVPGRPGAGTSASGPGTLYTTSPEFLRLEVQRRRVGFDGKPLQVLGKTGKAEDAAYETFDHQGIFFDAFVRFETPMFTETPKKIEYVERVKEKDGDRMIDQKVEYELDLRMFKRETQGLTAPLPRVADNMALDYPPAVNLRYIHDNARRLAKLLENPQDKQKFEKQFEKKNSSNPYSLGSQLGTQGNNGIGFGSGSDEGRGGLSVPPTGPGEAMGGYPGMPMPGPGGRPGLGGLGMPGMSGPGMPGSGNMSGTGNLTDPNAIGAEFILIRFLDPTLLPGESYKYRARLVMRNPNFGKKDQMATEADADKLEIESPDDWYECPQTASLPTEFHLFAGTAKTYETAHTEEITKQLETLKDSTRKPEAQRAYLAFTETKDVAAGKKAVVQVQWWLPQLILPGTNSQEPIGAWVTADLPVGPGEFIGRKALVPLPLWSSKTETYVMSSRKLQKGGIAGLRSDETPPGQIVNFTTPNLLVDFDGRKTPVAAKDKDKEDNDVANELLVLRSDGTVEVLSEVQAAADATRTKRLDLWTKWVADVMKRKEQGVTPPPGTGTGPGGRGSDDR